MSLRHTSVSAVEPARTLQPGVACPQTAMALTLGAVLRTVRLQAPLWASQSLSDRSLLADTSSSGLAGTKATADTLHRQQLWRQARSVQHLRWRPGAPGSVAGQQAD